jgi:hypothetical protein
LRDNLGIQKKRKESAMKYKIVPDAERLIVVNEEAFGLFMDCTPNLG